MINTVSAEYIVRAYAEGNSIREIAKVLKVSMATVQRRMVAEGIPRRSTKGLAKSMAHRQKLSEAKRGQWSGENNPNWNGGIGASKNERNHQDLAYWRGTVKRRDNFICQMCGMDGKVPCPHCGIKPVMHSDHIKSWADYPDLRFNTSNGRTLCEKCHRSLGKRRELLETPSGTISSQAE